MAPERAPELAPELTALRCVFLLAMHHGQHLTPAELPVPGAGDMTGWNR